MKMKMTYVRPNMEELKVSLESPICAGSVDFIGDNEKRQIDIQSQEVATVENNDFSSNEWEINN